MAKKRKRHLRKSIAVSLVILLLVIGALVVRGLLHRRAYQNAYDAMVLEVNQDALNVEYGDDFNQSLIVKQASAEAKVSGEVNTMKVGTQELVYTMENTDKYGKVVKREFPVAVKVSDTSPAEIVLNQDVVVIAVGQAYDLKSNIVSVKDRVDGDLVYSEKLTDNTYTMSGNLDVNIAGTYPVTVQAKDANGNESQKSFEVQVRDIPDTDLPYAIKVNRAADTVTIYMMDENGSYSIPIKAMVCSTGRATPLGSYAISWKLRWQSLFGNVYGQYAQQIVGDILFHSVPYYSPNANDLEYEEYNKLGTPASMGCVRLCVRDVKWIYDNCPMGTSVELYDDADNPGPLGKPESIQIDLNDERRGWDPTDPDPANPWNA